MPDKHGRNNSRYVKDNHRLRATAPPYCSGPWGCGEYIDRTLPPTDPMSWTSDHITALGNGGDLYGPRVPMHRSCNTRKGKRTEPPPDQTITITTTEDW